MKFGEILREAGIEAKNFPKCAEISVTLYDRKDRVIDREIHFVEKLFVQNEESFAKFKHFLEILEKEDISEMNVRIDEFNVILFYKSSDILFFSRMKKVDPLDYMD